MQDSASSGIFTPCPQTSPSESSTADRAPNVCRACRARKRRCDKSLPSCSPCAKRKVKCSYGLPEWPYTPISREEEGLPERREVPLATPGRALDYPTVSFLDPSLLQYGQLQFPQTTSTVPPHVLSLLGDEDDIMANINHYCQHTHVWLPFLSSTRLRQLIQPAKSLQTLSGDVALLLLSVRLISTVPDPQSPRTTLYHTVKHSHLDIATSPGLSVTTLQASVLIALYEIAHAIYPAAFLSIAGCARYGHALGIDVPHTVPARRPTTLVEMEERRRVWWAIIVLDRFVSIGSPGRPLAAADPDLDCILPADDEDWERGTISPTFSSHSTVGSPTTSQMSKFALICQAARLLGQVPHILFSSSSSPSSSESYIQLDRTLHSMLHASLSLQPPDLDQITFIYSTLAALHAPALTRPHAHIAPPQQRTALARAFFRQLTERIATNLIEARCLAERDADDMPPWGLFFAYRVCVVLVTGALPDTGDARDVERALREPLRKLAGRWGAAGVYLRLLEAQEAIAQS